MNTVVSYNIFCKVWNINHNWTLYFNGKKVMSVHRPSVTNFCSKVHIFLNEQKVPERTILKPNQHLCLFLEIFFYETFQICLLWRGIFFSICGKKETKKVPYSLWVKYFRNPNSSAIFKLPLYNILRIHYPSIHYVSCYISIVFASVW